MPHVRHVSLLTALWLIGIPKTTGPSSAAKCRWATAISAGVGDTGYERNSAVFIFEVTITLTEAGLHAAPGVHPMLYARRTAFHASLPYMHMFLCVLL